MLPPLCFISLIFKKVSYKYLSNLFKESLLWMCTNFIFKCQYQFDFFSNVYQFNFAHMLLSHFPCTIILALQPKPYNQRGLSKCTVFVCTERYNYLYLIIWTMTTLICPYHSNHLNLKSLSFLKLFKIIDNDLFKQF